MGTWTQQQKIRSAGILELSSVLEFGMESLTHCMVSQHLPGGLPVQSHFCLFAQSTRSINTSRQALGIQHERDSPCQVSLCRVTKVLPEHLRTTVIY